ncbi:MAG: squalene/phytoene synthase family protein [Alphaproteobacteria bacterium]|nr:squalene/phytoene synthase family protein [Alphaproteobacteria bacterium]
MALESCEELVRRHDCDRYLAALFAPGAVRPYLHALYAFNYEIARIAESVHEPMMAEIRRQWWREAVDEAAQGRPRRHDVAEALAELFAHTDADPARFIALIDARAKDDSAEQFADMAELEAYADATAGEVMRIGARILGTGDSLDPLSRAAGIAYGLTGVMRAIPYRAARAKLDLPADLMTQLDLSRERMLAGDGGRALAQALHTLGERALRHLDAARAFQIERDALPAVLPTALCELYLRRMLRRGFEPFRHSTQYAQWRRQLILLAGALRARI